MPQTGPPPLLMIGWDAAAASLIEQWTDDGTLPILAPMSDVAGLISQWKSIGDLEMTGDGSGRLIYDAGDNLYDSGFNMIMIFGKVSDGQHAGPEDFSKLMIECNGPLTGTKGSAGMEAALTVLSNK